MKIQTYSIVAGTEACDAKCPYCVSQMTPEMGMDYKKQDINWRNFDIGCKYAKQNDVATVLITGKGEPILYPEQINDYLEHLKPHEFPFIELQTNGMQFAKNKEKYEGYLKSWYDAGLTTIAISVAHHESEKNKEIYSPNSEYIDLPDLIDDLHDIGFSVRLSCMLQKGYIDDVESIDDLVDFAKENEVEQLTVRSISKPNNCRNETIEKYVDEHLISDEEIQEIREFLDKNGDRIMELTHGAIVYDYKDQNICLSNCLTIEPEDKNQLRQLIFFPDGHLRYDWQHKGAILL